MILCYLLCVFDGFFRIKLWFSSPDVCILKRRVHSCDCCCVRERERAQKEEERREERDGSSSKIVPIISLLDKYDFKVSKIWNPAKN